MNTEITGLTRWSGRGRAVPGGNPGTGPMVLGAGPGLPAPSAVAIGSVASALQRSDEPSAGQVRQATGAAIGAFGALGCVARVAQAYGEHPETAVTRMLWARAAVAGAFGGSQPEPAHAPKPGQYTVPFTFRAACAATAAVVPAWAAAR